MQGGGFGDQEKDYMMRHFSDYSVNQMQNCMERKMLFWDEERKAYYRWNEETKSFSTKMESDGWDLAAWLLLYLLSSPSNPSMRSVDL